ncbi:MAG: hypothetical protein PQJ61_09025 [Spirochaetales bacterium]|uniref:Uncharacterized protein n=1 Tax=Candidatus Thalassospirochaeta sargassi TaxID=3119039 RepID=A0AAJ1MJT0_9SPIO|nr:hypothetical protein [Spirochaetales bacterium]
MNTRTTLTATFRALDTEGKEYLVEEYTVYTEVFSRNKTYWETLDKLYFTDSAMARYNEKDNTFTVYDSRHVLKRVG